MPKPMSIPRTNCGKLRKVYPDRRKYRTGLCSQCYHKQHKNFAPSGKESRQWKGGRKKDATNGHVSVYLFPDNPYYAMVNDHDSYVLEHRLVMAIHLERCLTSEEEVHHLNGIRDDNRIENLALVNKYNHPRQTLLHILQTRIKTLESQLKGVA